MKAAFLVKPSKIIDKPLIIKNVKIGELGSDEILIKIRSCGICKIDLELIEGRLYDHGSAKLPIIPGHEIIGTIEEIGEYVHDLKRGDRVALGLIYDSCNICNHCKNNEFEYCESLSLTGIHANGGFAEYVKAKANKVIKIPNFIEDTDNHFLCEFLFAIKAIENIENPFEDKIAIIGEDLTAKMINELLKIKNIETKSFVRRNIDNENLNYKTIEKGYFNIAIITYDSPDIIEFVINKIKKGGKIILFSHSTIRLPSFLEGKKIISIGIPGFREFRKALEYYRYIKNFNLDKKSFELESINDVILEMKQNNKKFILLNKA